jgi:hypothetical protein
MALVNVPVPVPSVVFESVIVGFAAVPQQTPRAVTADVPSEVTFPPEVAEETDSDEIAVVVTAGGSDLSFLQAEKGTAIKTARAIK